VPVLHHINCLSLKWTGEYASDEYGRSRGLGALYRFIDKKKASDCSTLTMTILTYSMSSGTHRQ
jgi:hypothetical protein